MKSITTLVLVLIAQVSIGQIDKEKMQRDIEVAENILTTLSNDNDGANNSIVFGKGMYEGRYVEGYGIVFNSKFSAIRITRVNGNSFGYSSSSVTVSRKGSESNSKDEVDKVKAAAQENWIEQMKIFYSDYAHLISQLKEGDKIMITNGPSVFSSGRNEFRFGNQREQTKLEAKFEDIKDYQSGKLSKEKFIDRISVNISVPEDVEKDIQLLANIFQTLYKRDISDTYWVSGVIYPEKLSGLGAVLKMKVYSSVLDDGLYVLETRNKSGLSEEEREKEVKEMYPEFVEGLKSNMVSYGRTVKSLEEDEKLMLRVELTTCNGCDIPETIELSVSAADLSDYNQGKLSEEQAIKKINIEEIGNQ